MDWSGYSFRIRASAAKHIIILASAVDAADNALLPATFKAMSATMELGPKGLGMLQFAQTLAFALALPLWGSLLRYYDARDLLIAGCLLWGLATCLVAGTTLFWLQMVLRFFVGAALASINPLGQAMLCDLVPESERGRVFGLQQSAQAGLAMLVSFGATALAMKSFVGIQGWRLVYAAVAIMSLGTGIAVRAVVPSKGQPKSNHDGRSWLAEQRRMVCAVARKPSFVIIVLQGVVGGVPWNAFAFLPFYFQLSGLSDFQAGQVMFWGGIGSVFGGLLGGALGDCFNKLVPLRGRCMVSVASVLLGIAAFVWLMKIPQGAGSCFMLTVVHFLFKMVAVWTGPAALRPICGELFTDPEERAQVLSLWIALETAVSAVLGAPLCGLLSEFFGYNLVISRAGDFQGDTTESLMALRRALLGVCIPLWILCALAWVPMFWTFPRDRVIAGSTEQSKPLFTADMTDCP